MLSKAITAARLKVYINNRVFAVATDWNVNVDYGNHAIRGLDQSQPAEIADGPITIMANFSVIRLQLEGGLEGFGVVAPVHQNILEKYITICVVDRHTEQVIFQSDKARVKNQSWRGTTKGVLLGSFQVECIGYASDLGGA